MQILFKNNCLDEEDSYKCMDTSLNSYSESDLSSVNLEMNDSVKSLYEYLKQIYEEEKLKYLMR